MLLLLMRHGIAEERELWTGDDTLRPLTPEGQIKTREAVRGLSTLVERVDLIASSPLVRAAQTAEIAREFYPKVKYEIWDELVDAESSALSVRLAKLPKQFAVLLVGHEPGLSELALDLLGSGNSQALELKKAGACAFQCDPDLSHATLQWHATPKMLRRLTQGAE